MTLSYFLILFSLKSILIQFHKIMQFYCSNYPTTTIVRSGSSYSNFCPHTAQGRYSKKRVGEPGKFTRFSYPGNRTLSWGLTLIQKNRPRIRCLPAAEGKLTHNPLLWISPKIWRFRIRQFKIRQIKIYFLYQSISNRLENYRTKLRMVSTHILTTCVLHNLAKILKLPEITIE